ncbi:MAG: hypothetical protein PHS54_01375 [Clostridia bacterium]|nr:hypothetical protein [Clostridia bacterium]
MKKETIKLSYDLIWKLEIIKKRYKIKDLDFLLRIIIERCEKEIEKELSLYL